MRYDAGPVILPLWAVMTVTVATLGCYLGCAWEGYGGNRRAVWTRLVGGFVLVVLNLNALIVMVHGYSFDVARISLRVALFADTFVAGAVVGAAAKTVLTPWWEGRARR